MRDKPPIGIKPKFIHDEHRMQEIAEAIERFLKRGYEIPLAWIVEYNQLAADKNVKVSR
jgi:hypothetical protein